MKQKLLLIFVAVFVLIIGILVFWGFKILGKITPQDELSTIFYDLKWTTGIEFSETKETEIKWKTKAKDGIKQIIIEGKYVQAKNISREEQSKIKSFLENEGFQLDSYNISVGHFSATIGYKKEKINCLLEGETVLNDSGLPLDPVKMDIKISCGMKETIS